MKAQRVSLLPWYGSTDETPQPPPTTVVVEVHEEAAKQDGQQPEAGKEEDE